MSHFMCESQSRNGMVLDDDVRSPEHGGTGPFAKDVHNEHRLVLACRNRQARHTTTFHILSHQPQARVLPVSVDEYDFAELHPYVEVAVLECVIHASQSDDKSVL